MRILHTVQFYAPENGGGVQEVVRQVSEGLARRGHDVTIATGYSPSRKQFEINGVKIRQFRVKCFLNQSILGIYGDTQQYIDYLRLGAFDVIMNYAAQTWHADLTHRVLGTLRAKTILATCGYSGLIPPRSILYWRYFRRLPSVLNRYDAVVYHSANYRDKHFGDRHGIRHFRIIPNGFDSGELRESSIQFRRRYRIDTPYMVLSVGNHFSNKGHDRIIEAFRLLGRGDVTLVIIGRNVASWYRSCRMKCRRAAETSAGRIVLLEDAPRPHLIAAYREADVFLSGSRIEAFPLVIVESMAMAVPFIAFPAGNIEELPGGVVVRSSEEMARQLDHLLGDTGGRRALGRIGQREQQEKYEWDAIVAQYESLYRELLQ
jgi:glycosyltransferase involved in cell wall biosynthesis